MGRVYLEGCLQLSIQDTLLSGTEFRYFHPDGSLGFACHAKTGVGAPPINLPPACFPSPGNRVLTVETLINVNFRIPIDDLAVGNHHHRARTFRIDNATTDNSALANRLRQFLIEEGFQAAQDFVSGSQFPKTLRGIRGLNAAFAADCKTPDGQRDEIRCLILVTGQRRTIQTGASRGGQTRQGEEDIANLSVTLVLTSRGENVQHARMLSRLAVNLENQLLSLTRRTI
jgi:CRISPR/Cas system-associated protein endoribonuclease Cas2